MVADVQLENKGHLKLLFSDKVHLAGKSMIKSQMHFESQMSSPF